ncbi:MAG: 4-hydroxy-tetrahydrodipicolinate synthase [Polyangiaceae bacterium]|jgi:4-hydroxy-tetrahydrodipicolinate synthase
MNLRLEGTYTALVTPFTDEAGQPIDWDAFDAFIEAQIAGGVAGVVPCGTTGECATLSPEEHRRVIERTVARVKRRVQVIAGTGSNSTREAVALSQDAVRAGADAVMVIVPYYNRPSQEGLYLHFVEVARSVNLPVVVYNVPARTGVDLAAETLARIAEAAPNVVAVKEATGNVLRAQQLARTLGPRLVVLSGDDGLTLPMIAVGARGVVSVTSNLLPAEVAEATRLAIDGKADEARRAHLRLLGVHEAMFFEASPAPVKAALAMSGAMKATVRPPLAPCSEKGRQAVAAALEGFARGAR